MCTMTWCRGADGYDVFFNRDERRTRLPAAPPKVACRRDVRYLAPTDADAGGTWLSVSERGMTWGIANFYTRAMDVRPPAARSRGQLVRDLSDVADLTEAAARLESEPLESYNPFLFVGLDRTGKGRRWIWDGIRLMSDVVDGNDLPITTNPYDPERAARLRRAVLREWVRAEGSLNPAALGAFHRDRRGPDPTYDVCMRTPAARTVSVSHVEVRANRVWFDYRPVAEDRSVPASGVRRSLPRRG